MVSGISVGERSRSFNRGAPGHVVEANRLIRVAQRKHNFYPVILAGGRGTRFWPLSRKRRAKQLLALDGTQTMIQQTVARLLPLASAKNFRVITNGDLSLAIGRQLPKLSRRQIVAEPVG